MDQRSHRIVPLLLGSICSLGILMWAQVVPSDWLTEQEQFKQVRQWTGQFRPSVLETPTVETVRHENVKVMAHYMPWFKRRATDTEKVEWEHWQWNGEETQHDPNNVLENGQHDIASTFYPAIGPYDSHDPAVIEYHILTAKLIGIEAFMCNWYGPDSFTDKSIEAMLPIAEKYQFQIGICFEEKALFPPYSSAGSRDDLVDELEKHLNHILGKYSDSPAFLTHNNKPLLYVFNFYDKGPLGSNLLSSSEIELARSRIEEDILIVRNQIDADQFPAADGAYVWCSDKAQREKIYQELRILKTRGVLKYRSAVVSPGFDDSGVQGWGAVVRQLDRRGTDEYADNWRQAIKENYDSVQVVTWNDFQEGTTIEPTVEYGFEFADFTESGVEMLTGRVAELSDNQLGLRIYRLRKAVSKVVGEHTQQALNKEIDGLALDIFDAEATSIETRFAELEARLKRLVSGSN